MPGATCPLHSRRQKRGPYHDHVAKYPIYDKGDMYIPQLVGVLCVRRHNRLCFCCQTGRGCKFYTPSSLSHLPLLRRRLIHAWIVCKSSVCNGNVIVEKIEGVLVLDVRQWVVIIRELDWQGDCIGVNRIREDLTWQ